MKNKRKGLGRGLSSILRNPEINITSKGRGEIDHSTTETKEIEINKISQNPFQPRHQFDISKLDELAHSIKKLGLIGHFLLFFLTVDLDYGYHYY